MIVCINAVTEQAFWQLPDAFLGTIAAKLPSDAEVVVARSLAELGGAVRRANIVLGWPFPLAMARGAKELAWVHFFTSGIPESWQKEERIRVTSMRGRSARSVAEHALFLTTALLRGATRSTFTAWSPDRVLVPRAAERMHVAVFGAGAVGRAIADLVAPLVASVTLVVRDGASRDDPRARPAAEWREVLAENDVIVLALPLTTETRALVGKDFFAELRPKALVVNVASGALVEETNVLAFLARDPASRYAADVAHPEPYPGGGALYASEQVLLTPHVGARREDAWAAIATRTLEVLDEALGELAGDRS